MNEAAHPSFSAPFVAVPKVLLALRLVLGKRMCRWVALALAALLRWLFSPWFLVYLLIVSIRKAAVARRGIEA